MDADFSIELSREDPVLDLPWTDPAAKVAYVDLKRHPELMPRIEEAEKFPELRDFLQTLNSAPSKVETAKCDAWATSDLSVEEDVYAASHKFASYVDVVFSAIDARLSLPAHEQFARTLVESLRRLPEIRAAAEVCVRRCFFAQQDGVREGFYCTLYVSGYGPDEGSARQQWGAGLKLAENAIAQLSGLR
jgi:hypothetical protein